MQTKKQTNETTTEKECKKCHIVKSADHFYNAAARPDGKESTCIACRWLMTQEEYDNRKNKKIAKDEPAPVVTQPDAPKKSTKQVSRKEKAVSVEKAEKSKRKPTEKAAKKKSKPT